QRLDDRRDAHADADALRRQAVALAAAAQFVRDRRDEPRAGRAERVADGDRAAVDVDAVERDAELLARGQDLRRERLVELDAVDLVGGDAGVLHRLVVAGTGPRPITCGFTPATPMP